MKKSMVLLCAMALTSNTKAIESRYDRGKHSNGHSQCVVYTVKNPPYRIVQNLAEELVIINNSWSYKKITISMDNSCCEIDHSTSYEGIVDYLKIVLGNNIEISCESCSEDAIEPIV